MTVLIFSNPFLFQGELLWPLFPSILKHTHTHISAPRAWEEYKKQSGS